MELMVSYQKAKELSKEEIGNKAYNLLQLYPQFLIPKGIIIPVKAAQYIKKTIDKEILQEKLESAVEDIKAVAFSVRSSTTCEDSRNYSFAGQFLTKCGVSYTELADACMEVISSPEKAKVQRYADYAGQHAVADIAILIQEMLPCDVSGIMFTKNPVSQEKGEIIIEAIFGTGEYIVSGIVNPDHIEAAKGKKRYNYTRGNQEKGLFLRGSKLEERVVMNTEPVLQKYQIFELMQQGIQIERFFGVPQDIEWGIVKNEIYILQTRPITT
ncbi:hypothetical protein HZA98_04455 [Candidatus Woesearchaeota archaeon]|nr:hypothetical protein [Candidatus Woesearchaeota archaeon]